MAKKKDREVAGIILFRKTQNGREYLLLQKRKDPDSWSPPKGRLDEDETQIKAAIRELREETGLEEKDVNIIINSKKIYEFPKKHLKELTYWIGYVHDGNVKIKLSSEHSQYKWLSVNDMGFIDEINKKVIEDAENYLTTQSWS